MDNGSSSRRDLTQGQGPRGDPTTFSMRSSTSNISCFSCASSTTSTIVGQRTRVLRVPREPHEFGARIDPDGRVTGLLLGGLAHSSGVIQVGDYIRKIDLPNGHQVKENDGSDPRGKVGSMVSVTYGVLQVDSRSLCPFEIEIGNRSRTPLGIALTQTQHQRIQISSIKPMSIAERCGFLRPGDILTFIHMSSNQRIPCSPYYTPSQIAKVLRNLSAQKTSVTLTILPYRPPLSLSSLPSDDLNLDPSGTGSQSTLGGSSTFIVSTPVPPSGHDDDDDESLRSRSRSSSRRGQHDHSSSGSTSTTIQEEDPVVSSTPSRSKPDKPIYFILTISLWKDPLYEDWGFSLMDEGDLDLEKVEAGVQVQSQSHGASIHQIRRGGPAWHSGLRKGDKILRINDRNVSKLESTLLVPILASVDDPLQLVILRSSSFKPNS